MKIRSSFSGELSGHSASVAPENHYCDSTRTGGKTQKRTLTAGARPESGCHPRYGDVYVVRLSEKKKQPGLAVSLLCDGHFCRSYVRYGDRLSAGDVRPLASSTTVQETPDVDLDPSGQKYNPRDIIVLCTTYPERQQPKS